MYGGGPSVLHAVAPLTFDVLCALPVVPHRYRHVPLVPLARDDVAAYRDAVCTSLLDFPRHLAVESASLQRLDESLRATPERDVFAGRASHFFVLLLCDNHPDALAQYKKRLGGSGPCSPELRELYLSVSSGVDARLDSALRTLDACVSALLRRELADRFEVVRAHLDAPFYMEQAPAMLVLAAGHFSVSFFEAVCARMAAYVDIDALRRVRQLVLADCTLYCEALRRLPPDPAPLARFDSVRLPGVPAHDRNRVVFAMLYAEPADVFRVFEWPLSADDVREMTRLANQEGFTLTLTEFFEFLLSPPISQS